MGIIGVLLMNLLVLTGCSLLFKTVYFDFADKNLIPEEQAAVYVTIPASYVTIEGYKGRMILNNSTESNLWEIVTPGTHTFHGNYAATQGNKLYEVKGLSATADLKPGRYYRLSATQSSLFIVDITETPNMQGKIAELNGRLGRK
jgi:hypothetical protein